MENVTLSKDQKLITITEDRWKEYEDNTRKALNNTITVRKEEYKDYQYWTRSYSETEYQYISSALPELSEITKYNWRILSLLRHQHNTAHKLQEKLQKEKELLGDAKKEIEYKKEKYNQEIQKVPKFIRKWFKVNI